MIWIVGIYDGDCGEGWCFVCTSLSVDDGVGPLSSGFYFGFTLSWVKSVKVLDAGR